MTRKIHHSQPPRIEELLKITSMHNLRFVLVGSVAAMSYGVDVGKPGDLDIVPSLDHLYYTRLGNFDVASKIAGDYETLMGRSLTRVLSGIEVQVVHIDELLARLTIPRRNKDIEQVQMLREIQGDLKS